MPQVLVLHRLPGIAMTVAFIVIAWLAAPLGWPPNLALRLAWLAAGTPVLSGVLWYFARSGGGTPGLGPVLPYREPLRHYAWLVPVLFV